VSFQTMSVLLSHFCLYFPFLFFCFPVFILVWKYQQDYGTPNVDLSFDFITRTIEPRTPDTMNSERWLGLKKFYRFRSKHSLCPRHQIYDNRVI
jgi:hypothetical protein